MADFVPHETFCSNCEGRLAGIQDRDGNAIENFSWCSSCGAMQSPHWILVPKCSRTPEEPLTQRVQGSKGTYYSIGIENV